MEKFSGKEGALPQLEKISNEASDILEQLSSLRESAQRNGEHGQEILGKPAKQGIGERIANSLVHQLYDFIEDGGPDLLLKVPKLRSIGLRLLVALDDDIHPLELATLEPGYSVDNLRETILRSIDLNRERIASIIESGSFEERGLALGVFDTGARFSKEHYQEYRDFLNALDPNLIQNGLKKKPSIFVRLVPYGGGTPEERTELIQCVQEMPEKYRIAATAHLFAEEEWRSFLFGWDKLRTLLPNTDLDPYKLMEWWAVSGTKGNKLECIRRNLARMTSLEKQAPGSTKKLNEDFGIHDFARYPIEVLLAQYRQDTYKGLPYGAVIFPRTDWNGAFYNENLLKDLYLQMGGRSLLRIAECSSKFEVGKQLAQMRKRYGKASFLILGGHGDTRSITFDEKGDGGNLHLMDIVGEFRGKFAKRADRYLQDDASVVLMSCSTGSDYGIAMNASDALPNLTISAPNVPTAVTKIEFAMDKKGRINLSPIYSAKESRRVFGAGTKSVDIS